MRHRTALLAFPLATLLSLASARAENVEKQLDAAYKQVKSKNYEAAIGRTKPLLDKLLLNTVEEIITAHKILGVSYCELGDQEKASEHFKALVTFSPTETIDDLVRTKPCISLYASVQGVPAPAVRPPTPKKEEATAKLSAPPAPKERGRWKLYVPFGTGQFFNQERPKGWAFLSTEVLATAAAATTFALFQSEKNPDGTFTDSHRASVYRALFWSSLGVGTVTAVWGIIDAVVVHNDRTASRTAGIRFDGASITMNFD